MVKKNVSREIDGSRDVMVENSDGEGFGLIVPRPLSGLVKLNAADVIGPAVGTVGALVGTLIARRFGGRISAQISGNFAPLFGAVFGALASLPLYWWKGSGVVTNAILTSVAVGAGIFGYEMLLAPGGMLAGIVTEPIRGIVTEPIRGYEGMGALPARAFESTSLPRSVELQINPDVFGRAV